MVEEAKRALFDIEYYKKDYKSLAIKIVKKAAPAHIKFLLKWVVTIEYFNFFNKQWSRIIK